MERVPEGGGSRMGRVLAVVIVVMMSVGPLGQAVMIEPKVYEEPEITRSPLSPPPSLDIDIDPNEMLTNLGGFFTENLGQMDESAGRYYCLGSSLSIAFGEGWVSYDLRPQDSNEGVLVRASLDRCNPVVPVGVDPLAHGTNYLIGNDRDRWVTGARSYKGLLYTDVYEGIDLSYRFSDGRLKYEFTVLPGMDPQAIQWVHEGNEHLEIDQNSGELVIFTSVGPIVDAAPYAYQGIEGLKREVPSEYIITDEGKVSFRLGQYDHDVPLIIDPGLEFSTYIGADGQEMLGDFTVDASGCVYVCGQTRATSNFPVTPGAYQRTTDGRDGFVLKLDADGSKLEYSTHIGGDTDMTPVMSDDELLAIHVDEDGNAICSGGSNDPAFPTTPDAMKKVPEGKDVVLIKLNHNGTDLLYSTFFGGRGGQERGAYLDVYPNGNLLISGNTDSDDFPVVDGCWDTSYRGGVNSQYCAIISSNMTEILRCTYLPGLSVRFLSSTNEVYVMGSTVQGYIITCNASAYQRTAANSDDGYIFRLDPSLSTITAATFLGGFGTDHVAWMDEGQNGSLYLFGLTNSTDFPVTTDAYQSTFGGGGYDIFYTVMSPNLSQVHHSTYFGGIGRSYGWGIVTPDGDVIITGRSHRTEGSTFPLTDDAIDRSLGGEWEAFVSRFKANGSLAYSTLLGGSNDDVCVLPPHHDINTTICTVTSSDDFPTTPGAYCRAYGGVQDVAVTRLWTGPPNHAEVPSPPRNISASPGNRVVNLTWKGPEYDGGAPITGYNVYRGTSEDDVSELVGRSKVMRFTDYPPALGMAYHYAVTATNFRHESNRSLIVNVTVFGSPGAPLEFNATAGCSTVHLSWSPPEDTGGKSLEGYVILRGSDMTPPSEIARTGTVTSYDDDDVENGESYYYKLQAFNDMGPGLMTTSREARPVGPPSAPMLFMAQAGDEEVLLNWGNPDNDGGFPLLGYRLYRGSTSGSLQPLISFTMYTETYTDMGLINGQTYFYALRAFNSLGNGTLTRVLEAVPLGLPGVPVGLEATPSDGEVTLTWSPPEDTGGATISSYRVFRGLEATDLKFSFEVASTTHTDSGLVNGRTYYYAVKALNKKGESPLSDTVTAKPHRVPDEPGGLLVEVHEDFVELTWVGPLDDGGSPVKWYRIYKADEPGVYGEPKELNASVRNYIDTDVEPGKTYFYYITAVTDAGEGRPSVVKTIEMYGIPSAPTLHDIACGDEQVTLSWDRPSDDGGLAIKGYIVFRGFSEIDLVPIAELDTRYEYTDYNLMNGVTYHYAISARSDAGPGEWSAIKEGTPRRPLFVPGPPRSLSAETRGDSIELSWEVPQSDGGTTIRSYTVMRRTTDTGFKVITSGIRTTTFLDDDVEVGMTYIYQVLAVNDIGSGTPSETVEVGLKKTEEVGSSTISIILIACLCIVVAGTASIVSTESGRYRWGLLLGPLTTRLKREEVLDNKTRHALLGIIITNPGIHYQAIMREFDLKNGVAAYHLDVLEKENFIRSVRDGRLKRFYSTDTKVPRDRRATPEELREEILGLVVANPGISQKEVVNELGVESDTVGYHLRALVADGTIKDERQGKYMTYYRET